MPQLVDLVLKGRRVDWNRTVPLFTCTFGWTGYGSHLAGDIGRHLDNAAVTTKLPDGVK